MNCASEISSGLCALAKVSPENLSAIGHATITNTTAARYHALKTAARFFLNRSHARRPGEACCWIGLFIFHTRVEQGVGEVHEQVQPNQQNRVEQREGDDNRVVTIHRTIDEEHAD